MAKSKNKQITKINNKKVTNKSAPLIVEMRQRFSELIETERNQFDEEDIKRVAGDDFFVKRFLLSHRRNVDAAFRMMIGTLKWIKREGFRQIKPNHFPAEFYFIGALFDYEKDCEDNFTVYIRVKYILRCGPLVPHAVKWASKFFYDLDTKLNGSWYTVVIDFAECGLKNAEFDFIWHALNIMRTYLPACLRRILIVDLPKVLKFGWHIVKRLVPESERNLLVLITRSELTRFIAEEKLPDFCGGTCSRPYSGPRMVPPGCPTAIEYGLSKGIPSDQCIKIAKIYEPIIKEFHLFNVDESDDIVSRVEHELKCRHQGKRLDKPPLDILASKA